MILVTISIYIPCLMVGFLMKECEHGKLKDDSQKCTLSPHTFTLFVSVVAQVLSFSPAGREGTWATRTDKHFPFIDKRKRLIIKFGVLHPWAGDG